MLSFPYPRGAHAAQVALIALCLAAESAPAQSIEVKSVLIKLIERADVPARQAGVLSEYVVTEGKLVEDGDVLARTDDSEARMAHRRADLELQIAAQKAESTVETRAAEEEVLVAEADLKAANLARQQRADSVSPTELEHLRLKAALAKLRVEQVAQEQQTAELTRLQRATDLELAAHRLKERQIVAPFRGVVVERYRQRGEWVEVGEKIVRLIRLDRLRAEGFIDAQFAQRELVGRSVSVVVELPGRGVTRFAGKVTFVSPEIDPVNRQTRITAEIENQDLTLQPGLRAQMTVSADAPVKRT